MAADQDGQLAQHRLVAAGRQVRGHPVLDGVELLPGRVAASALVAAMLLPVRAPGSGRPASVRAPAAPGRYR
nr:hypothetical protein [Actinacidiphila oryziradicis]